MLDKLDLDAAIGKRAFQRARPQLEMRLATLQREARAAGVPVVVLFEGWGAAGKGTLINDLILPLDPRGFVVHSMGPPDLVQERQPFLCRFWPHTPARGRIALFDRGWYRYLLEKRVRGELKKKGFRRAAEDIVAFERQLHADGAVIVKFFLHISRKEQRQRFRRLADDPATAWRVTGRDRYQNRHYHAFAERAEELLTQTHNPVAPWTLVAAHDRRHAALTVFRTVIAALEKGLAAAVAPVAAPPPAQPARRRRAASVLAGTDLMQRVTRPVYERELKVLQERVRVLQFRAYRERLPVAILFEGWDAAGKGGAVRRLVQRLDPRGYEVVPVAAPDATEKAHHYLWRFWKRLPRPGHLTVFDRSWYGRVLVERVEGFCTPAEWGRAYDEINEMERHLAGNGMVLVKFWLHISPDEQLRRFRERERLEWKRWKITEEDWRNRAKWDAYAAAVDEMLLRTSTPPAPWTVVAADSKLFARLKVLNTVAAAIQGALGEE
jgi:polyphosphate:AMP phosphotransferase